MEKTFHNISCRHGSYEKNLDEIFERAASIDKTISYSYIWRKLPNIRSIPPIAFRSCRGILSLEKRFGLERLVAACACASQAHIFGYQDLLNILERGGDSDFLPSAENDGETDTAVRHVQHKYICGCDYFSKVVKTNSLKNKDYENEWKHPPLSLKRAGTWYLWNLWTAWNFMAWQRHFLKVSHPHLPIR